MSSACHWRREAIGCYPSSRISGYVVRSEPNCSRVSATSSCFQPKALRSNTRFRVDGSVSDRSVPGQLYGPFIFGWSLRQNGRRMPSMASQVLSILPGLPFAAAAVALSRVASITAFLGNDFQSRKSDFELRTGSNLAEEFVEASKGQRPWRPGLEKALTQQGSLSFALVSASALAQDHLHPIITTLRANPTFMSMLIAWTIAQVAKVFTYYLVVRKWDFKMVLGSGGMPSSHSALCFALTTSVAIAHGVSDALFPVCLGFTLIVMYDAAGVRRHAGHQAEVLNLIVEDLFKGHPVSERKLKELLGHTPLQVFAGAALGIVVGYLRSRHRLV